MAKVETARARVRQAMVRLPAMLAIMSVTAMVGSVLADRSYAGETVALSALIEATHLHGIAVDAESPSRIYLATHHGVFLVRSDGMATRVSENRDDYMGFTPHPTDPSVFYASGHPEGGGNLGVLKSTDGGRTWRRIAKGVKGPVDFHQMDVSKADPKIIYGVSGGLQVSTDGGHSWKLVGRLPAGLLDLAASGKAVKTIYAGIKRGLIVSRDGGKSWGYAHRLENPATMVHVAANGQVYAFLLGAGLLRAADPTIEWTELGNNFGEDYLLHLAVDPTNDYRLVAVTDKGQVWESLDGGMSWAAFGSR